LDVNSCNSEAAVKPKLLWLIAFILASLLTLGVESWIGKAGFHGTALRNTESTKTQESSSPEELAKLKVVGPLANWMNEMEATQEEGTVRGYEPSRQDRILATPSPAPVNILHKTFVLNRYATFEIQIPPGTKAASLSGGYESFTESADHRHEPEQVQMSLLNENEVQDLRNGKPGSVTYTVDPSAKQAIKWILNTNYERAEKYYLVLSHPSGGIKPTFVRADFTIQFD
jgi:hypothetical protein